MSETPASEIPAAPPSTKRDDLFIVAVAVSAVALVVAVVAVGFGARAIGESGGGGGRGAPLVATVSLTEFAITPATVAQGGSLHVKVDGSIAHNLAVEGTDLATPDLGSGESGHLGLGGLAPGTYTMFCEIAGHREAGMEATLEVTAGDGAASGPDGTLPTGGHGAHDPEEYARQTAAMIESMEAFPAETAGVGNQELAPTEVRADGTKVFDLTMELGDWEVEPGKVVEAWTFNGMVPAPLLRLDIGDAVEVRVHNELPLATDVHWHGVKVTNENDGVAPYTQPLIEPGESFTYDFVIREQTVAMYHPHAHGHMLLPNGMFGVVLGGQVRLPRGQTVGLEEIPADLEIAQEIPMVLNDAGVIGYSLNGKSFPATAPYTGKVGDWVLIHYYNEGTQIHPMHLHQFDQVVVAKDGLPLDHPYTADTVNVAPGERYSVLAHLDAPGTWVWHCHVLPHVERSEGMFGMVTAFLVE